MKRRLLKLLLIMFLPLAFLVGLMAFGLQSGGTVTAWGETGRPALPDQGGPQITAARFTSIPFGIDSPLPLAADGRSVQVSGPGECPEEGDSFRVRVTVVQMENRRKIRAIGETSGACEGSSGWWAMATARGNHILTAGLAEVCGHVIVYAERQGAAVGQWCRTVMLE